jgi:UDP-GlcNAc:undecaprenyl-phosphate/decaprenyl-phosphate GlcNAc-1-phosphate transferase
MAVPEPMLIALISFAASATACFLIVHSGRWHLAWTADRPDGQPQKFHARPVPRIGGAGVLAGLLVAGPWITLPASEIDVYWLLMLALLPAFLGGLAEDLTRRVGPGARLLLTVMTGAFAYSLAGVHFVRSDVDWLDAALAFAPFGYLALLLAVSGVAHSINIIDGHNGLAGGVAVIVLGALACVANDQGDALVSALCFAGFGAGLGFLLLNYPSGRLFMGDSGAYLLGCLIALSGALLVLRNPDVSPWFPLAVTIYPIWETLFSMLRRALAGQRVLAADACHLHSLVYRRLSQHWLRGRRSGDRHWRNATTTLPFWVANLLLAQCAIMWAHSSEAQQWLIVLAAAFYVVVYRRLVQAPRPAAEAPREEPRDQPAEK